jgi:hypothetical protein
MSATTGLQNALWDYLRAVCSAQAAAIAASHAAAIHRHEQCGAEYQGEQFNFITAHNGEQLICTAAMADIEALFVRAQRYTAQKARAIAARMEGATIHQYAITTDERGMYLQFLREAADTLWNCFYPHVKDLKFRGYLFDEGETMPSNDNGTYTIGKIFKANDGNIYKCVQIPYSAATIAANPNVETTTYAADMALYDFNDSYEAGDTFVDAANTALRVKLAIPAYNYTNGEYFELLSKAVFTKGKVVYFIGINENNPIPANHIEALLGLVCNYLYYFVLWRWYNMWMLPEERDYWYAELSRIAPFEIRRILTARQTTLRRPLSPFC